MLSGAFVMHVLALVFAGETMRRSENSSENAPPPHACQRTRSIAPPMTTVQQ